MPAVSIGQAKSTGGRVRIAGRVRILRPARPPRDDRPVAAELYADRERVSGRFAVEDETGVAIIDDDAIERWDAEAPGERLAIHDGDHVEVIGMARALTVPDLPGSYREGGTALCFDGTEDEPVHVVLLAAPESGAPPRVRIANEADEPAEEAELLPATEQAPARRAR